MDTKQYLSQISRLDRTIKNKLFELTELRELSESVSAVKSGEIVQTTPNFDKIGSAYCKIEDMENKINKLIDEYTRKRNQIISQVESIENEMQYIVLFSRYIERKTFEEIATENSYSWRQIIRIHGRALQEFERKYGHLYKR